MLDGSDPPLKGASGAHGCKCSRVPRPSRSRPLEIPAGRLITVPFRAVGPGAGRVIKDWAEEETDHPHGVIEAAYVHVVQNKVEAAHARSDLLERRRRLMDDWAAYLNGQP